MQLSQFIRQAMKKILTNILLCSFVLLCTSCFEEVDLGYPYHVIFPKEGGEQIITGDESYVSIEITNYDGDTGFSSENEDGTEYDEFEWLKVESKYNSNELKIYAEPNKSGKLRKLYITINSGPEYQEIQVMQK